MGKRADLLIVSMSAARQTPMYDPVSHLVYTTRGDDVQTMIVHGKILMRDRKVLTLDEKSVLADARAAAVKVRGRRPCAGALVEELRMLPVAGTCANPPAGYLPRSTSAMYGRLRYCSA